ncbi:MAG: class I SAM-dependent rRNA methyltransferase [Sphaerochaetaceae bacterium]|nr:class I SAM-dependent rRNA methyltransferase [Sphaerochaetaceae bacterium]
MIILNEGKEKQPLNNHPWVFSGAIKNASCKDGEIDQVMDANGHFLAWGYYDSQSHIPLHLMSWDKSETVDQLWWQEKIKESILRRKEFFEAGSSSGTTVFRVVHSEADMLGGLVIDIYSKVVRVIISSRLAWKFKDATIEILEKLLKPEMIVLNTDASYCSVEQLKQVIEYYKEGIQFYPEEKFEPIRVREDNLVYEIIPGTGQKSGFYCDQRENRKFVEQYLKDKTVLDGCCYSGGFTLHALRAGAKEVDAFDSSEDALHQLLTNVNINVENGQLSSDSREKVITEKVNIFEHMRHIEKNKYDVIILDPPKLAFTKGDLPRAKRAYKDMNRLAMERIKDGGILITFSCSGALSGEEFKAVLNWARKDAKVEGQIISSLGQGSDHPIRLAFLESEYLKGFVIRIMK